MSTKSGSGLKLLSRWASREIDMSLVSFRGAEHAGDVISVIGAMHHGKKYKHCGSLEGYWSDVIHILATPPFSGAGFP